MSGQQLRVLHLINEMGTGGAESLVVELVRRGPDVGWVSAVATSGGRRADELRAEGVGIHPVHLARRSTTGVVRAIRDARRAVHAFLPDVVVAHNVSASVVGRVATVGVRVPVVTVFHGVAAEDYRAAARILCRTSTTVVTVSSAITDRLVRAGYRGPRPTVIRNAVSIPAAEPDQAAARQRLGLADDAFVALCLARMVPQKRHDVLLDAWAQLDRPAHLLLAGDGPLRSQLEEQARAAGLRERVRFLGNRSDVDQLLAATDLTVLTSDWEGLPMAVLESLAAGRPVVATDVDGVREALADGGGRLVPPGDPAAVAGALRELHDAPAARAEAAAAGRDTLARHYDPQKMIKEYDALIQENRDPRWP